MRITYDKVANAAYIYLVDEIRPGQLAEGDTYVADIEMSDTAFIIERDADGRVLGIEILGASRMLHPDTLARADDITASEGA